ncbi:MAG: UDP-N-acetylglucosamine 2-epimerase (non-hydrolyzing) [Crocinitomicaceae bacterium]|nr:UDP-N-acetylglucosamine 2-epimerase (non-hydrolyzing) [Crocinitomicaceae bacterium]MDP4799468.1 UDP-N-acetylglucosamine 2-epimerase (non-hydrolyzing) [Crocinitomicaceae bacterium]MDP4868988.1 UDP-N-acetylglucosamine 2-epimerase (non-hydrolyzing) [Crocinitomicaceae bacterium]MDP4955230.1 UDP-N-acetylglucosamine 2-epimerase (non-hydrolyzing) [Crocinitomicaceae bacterium]
MTKKKILTVIGARPQIIKAAALSRAISTHFKDQLEEILVHTGQHYDENMSAVFFDELGIPKPHYNLAVGSGTHGHMTAAMLSGIESILAQEKPTAVVIYGDTNSTIAAALAAAKIHIPVVHIEAGLRSFHKAMPEEINRIAADHMSTLLFVPTQAGMNNLAKEGFELKHKANATIDAPNVYHCGDVMYDNSLYFAELSTQKSTIISDLSLNDLPFILCTIHRDSNTDDATALQGIFEALLELVKRTQMAVILPLHPRTRGKIQSLLSPEFQERLKAETRIQLIEPAGFLDMIALEKNARLIVTDSGGVQKEAYFFAKPCVILREQTEWVEVVAAGAAILTGAHTDRILSAAQQLLTLKIQTDPAIFGDGHAAHFICEKICTDLPC